MIIVEKMKNSIMLVDDEPGNLMVLSNLLRNSYDLRVANSGEKALSLINQGKIPDLILLDIIMPELDGYEFCELIKGKSETKDIPIIFISSMDQPGNEEKGLKMGAVDYITKPFVPSIVQSRVDTHIKLINSMREVKRLYIESIEMNRKLEEANQKLIELSHLDELIKIPNRREFNKRIRMEYQKSVIENKLISLIVIDIDFFKTYNDKYGHIKGDKALYKIGQEIQNTLDSCRYLAARYGGEEFVVILPDTDKNKALEISEKIRRNVENLKIMHEFSNISDYLTVSLGVLTARPNNFDTLEKFIDETDKLLYVAKSKGKNCIEVNFFDE
jgi:diguanylate cyclase (GGDEF)-like protein